MRALVLGGTGDQGWPLLRRLLATGHSVRAASRDAAAFDWSRFPGVQSFTAAPDDREALTRAMNGVDGVLMHLPFTFDRGFAEAMGRVIGGAAAAAGVRKIVFHTSCFVADHDIGSDGHDGRRDIEAALSQSGVPHVFVRSTVFMENMLRDWARPSIVNDGVFAYPAAPDMAVSWVSQKDIAAAMIAAWLEPDFVADRIVVGGPEALTGAEVAERLSRALDRKVEFRSLSPDEFAANMSLLQTGSAAFERGGLYDRMAEMYRWYNAQSPSVLAVEPKHLLGRLPLKPTPLLAWAAARNWRVSPRP